MTCAEFDTLLPEDQLLLVARTSTYLGVRRAGADLVHLYHLPGEVFVEVTPARLVQGVPHLRAFTGAADLESYTATLELPGWLPGVGNF